MVTASNLESKASIISATIIEKIRRQHIQLLWLVRELWRKDRDLIKEAYRQVKPPGYQGSFPQCASEVVMNLAGMIPDPQLGHSRLVSFAVQLARRYGKLQPELGQWVCGEFQVKRHKWQEWMKVKCRAKLTMPSTISARLYIAVERSQAIHDRYEFSAWSVADTEQYNHQTAQGCQRLNTVQGEPLTRAQISEQIPTLLDTWIKQSMAHSGGQKMRIEVFLPFDLLDLPVHTWQRNIRRGFSKTKLIGKTHPIVVRLLDRLGLDGECYEYFEDWRNHWRNREHYADGSKALICGDREHHIILEDLIETAAIGLHMKIIHEIMVADSPTEIIFTEGLPIALWLHRDLDACSKADEFWKLLSTPVNELPNQLLKLRKTSPDPHDLGNNVTLLWDDPTKLPPNANLFTNAAL